MDEDETPGVAALALGCLVLVSIACGAFVVLIALLG